jgi:hypothetical protein
MGAITAGDADGDDDGDDTTSVFGAVGGGKDPSAALFDVPTHVVPPMDKVAGTFMGLVLRKRKRSDEQDDDGNDGAGAASPSSTPALGAAQTHVAGGSGGGKVNASTASADALPSVGVAGGSSDLGFLVDFFKRGKTPEVLRNGKAASEHDAGNGDAKKKKKKSKKSKKSKKGADPKAEHSTPPSINVAPVTTTGLHPLSKRKKMSSKKAPAKRKSAV